MGLFDQVKEAMKMRSDMKRIQSEMEKITAQYDNGGITAVAKGDMTIASIAIAPETWAEAAGGKPERFQTMLVNVINGALKSAKQQMQANMTKMMGGPGGLFGGN